VRGFIWGSALATAWVDVEAELTDVMGMAERHRLADGDELLRRIWRIPNQVGSANRRCGRDKERNDNGNAVRCWPE